MERRLEPRPAVEVFVNNGGTITIRTEDLDGESLVALHPEQIPVVIRWLQECLDEIGVQGGDEEETVALPNAEQYAGALLQLEGQLTEAQRRLLAAHAQATGHTATARQLATAAGFSSWQAVNVQYGRLGSLLRQTTGYAGPGQQSYVIASFVQPGEACNTEWLWVMHPQLVAALRSLGWIPDV